MIKPQISETARYRELLHPQCAEGTSENRKSVQIFPFDEKCSDFSEVRRFSAEKRMQFREIWAFIGKSRPSPRASGKTNLMKSVQTLLTARESTQNLGDLLFSAVASRTLVLRTAENKAQITDQEAQCQGFFTKNKRRTSLYFQLVRQRP